MKVSGPFVRNQIYVIIRKKKKKKERNGIFKESKFFNPVIEKMYPIDINICNLTIIRKTQV